ncbi:MAG TPA: hypothetical protein VLJ76_05965 [Gaiellaceae bacterium]|nr:hypothetical protein [Gaiellaceae bacterium]
MNHAHVDELERIEMDEGFVWRPVRRRFGIRAFGVNAYTPREAGTQVVEDHTESQLQHEEIYLVLRGCARFTVGDDEHELGPGQLVFVRDPQLRRSAVALTADTAVLALGGKPGEAFTPSAWEWYFQAYELPTDDGIELLRRGLEELGERGPFYYHLACLEARAGRLEDAKTHLDRALELEPRLAENAAIDDDLKEVR